MALKPLREKIEKACVTWKEAVATACNRMRIALLDFAKTPPIFVYQMGKVGSMSVYTSLQRARLGRPIFHVHFLDLENLERIQQEYRDNRFLRIPEDIRIGRTLIRKVARTKNVRWTVITLVRDPVERDLSDFLQHPEWWQMQRLRYERGWIAKNQAHKFVTRLTKEFQRYDEATNFACTWFDRELKRVFGVDVYDYPFDQERGFGIIRTETVEVLVLRLSDLDRVFHPVVTQFLRRPEPIPLVRANEARDRDVANIYPVVLRNLTLDRRTCERIYATKFARHFFSEAMREAAIARWTKEGARLSAPESQILNPKS